MSDKYMLLGTVAAIALTVGAPARAQDSAPAAQAPTADSATAQSDEIVVTGLRASLQSASNLKRNSDQIQDSIVAEDIGKLPDTNIAETLQRIPGVQISRNTRGEGNTYVVHGLKQVMTTVDGRSLFGTTDRTAHLLDFSSDVLAGVDVYKTPTADQIEGGLGGLINIDTARPFNFDGFHLAMTGAATYSEFQDRAGPRISGIVSDRWNTGLGEFGLLLGGQFERFYSAGYQTSTNTYANNTALFGTTARMPTQVTPGYETGDRVRTSAYGSAQWKPSDTLEFHLDTIYSHSGGHSYTQQLSVQADSATKGIGTPVFKDGSTTPASYSLSNALLKSSVNSYDNPYDTLNVAFGGKYSSGPFQLTAEASYVRSHGPFYARNAAITTRAPRADITLTGSTPNVVLSGVDPTNAAAFGSASFFEYDTQQDGREPSFRADASYDIDGGPITSLMAGFRWAHHRAIYDFGSRGGSLVTQPLSAIIGQTPDDLFEGQDVSTNQWTVVSSVFTKYPLTYRRLYNAPPGDPANAPGSHYDYRETTIAGYAEAKFGFDLIVPIDGNVGVRYVRTDPNQTVLVANGSGGYAPLSGGTAYDDWLPSANVRFKFTPNLFLRLGYSKALTRPDFGNLSPAVLTNPTTLTASAGNPALQPTKADQYDASLEFYYGKSNYLSAALFEKDVNGFVQKFAANEDIGGVTYLVTRPRNSSNGTIKGFELTAQQFFDFLPGLLSGLGVQGNYTYVDSKLTVPGIARTVPADLLSKNAYNVTGIYEKGPISFHASYNWRSKSLQTNNADAMQTLWNAPQQSLDFSLTYSVNKWLSVKADMVNATIAYQNQFYGTPDQPALSDQLDRSYQLGFHINL